MLEIWTQWKPIENLEEKYYINYVLDSREIFKILLYNEKNEKKVLITFENSVAAYRREDETLRSKLVYDLDLQYGSFFMADGLFLKLIIHHIYNGYQNNHLVSLMIED